MTENLFHDPETVDLDDLVEMISEKLKNPITIEDAKHRLIAYSTHGNWTDEARRETIMGRRVPEPVLNRLWQDGVIQDLMTCDDPIRIQAKNEVGLGTRVAISVRKGQSVLGYIWVQEVNEPLGQEQFKILRMASRAAMPRLHQRQVRRRIQEEKGKEFFWEMLLGTVQSHYEILTRAEDIGIKLPKIFSIFVFECDTAKYQSLEKEISYLLTNLRDTFSLHSFPLWVTSQNRFILMAGDREATSDFHQAACYFVQEMKMKIRERFGNVVMAGSFGNAYQSFASVEQSYQQAMAVLRMKKLLPKETEGISGYPELGLYRFIPLVLEKNLIEQHQNYRLEKLLQYDKENQSDLLHTLEVYFDCAGKVNAAANVLHIHPNTLAYRLKRIAEVAQLNLDDPNQRFSMFLDIKLLKLGKSL
ncbi:PucR family transcriptional regulator [Ammoniphilus resinae]|uniref:DNA-binding PucR family transcriptional regulator n=1 Tax=Ammoniphilus resinae TaxID=861532 RepID=A0ABS4GMW2_9BACL|nr:helix-turn-helix domain-containing protein [Ammoniphilus resinae]MBP1931402.1 DNA-binding PucR family transcriptional regulator [Ammoniphilus resinae]